MSQLHRDIAKRNMAGGLPPRVPLAGPSFARGGAAARRRMSKDYTPLPWQSYFDEIVEYKVPDTDDTFRVYLSSFDDSDYGNKPLLVLLHGGGYSGLSWAVFVKSLLETCHCKVAAIDLRGHGASKTDNDEDLSIKTLSTDVGHIYASLLKDKMNNEEPAVILMGHSMGGAVAVHVASNCQEMVPSVLGLVVIDVVEGTALEALQGMQSVLRCRPKEFPNLQHAIEWSLRSGQTKNLEAARISMPGMLIKKDTACNPIPAANKEVGIHEIREDEEEHEKVGTIGNKVDQKEEEMKRPSSSDQSEQGNSNNKPTSSDGDNEVYVWRTNLSKSEVYWRGWFEGLSDLFLSAPCQAKLLLLAGIDRLDRPLTVGQMQGKFQMQVLPDSGHAVHEDVPDKVSEVVATFLIRNRLTVAKKDFTPSFPGC